MALLQKLRIAPEIEEQIGDEFPQDPAPTERPAARGKKPAPRKVAAPRSPTVAKLAKEVGEDLATMLGMTAAAWSLTDQCCAPVLEEQAPDIAKALTAILARNPRLLAKLAQADTAILAMQVVALGKALLPVGQAIYRNHVAKEDGEHGGGVPLDHFPAYPGHVA